MEFETFDIAGPILCVPRKFGDHRGFFMETYKKSAFDAAVGRAVDFVQDNHSLSATPGTVRGLHYQSPPHAQGKLVRCVRGAIVDIAVDARVGSPTYGAHVRAELSAENGHQLWVPEGFLHGFSTLEPDCEVVYKVTDVYAPDCDGNVLWNDPDLALDWGIDAKAAVVSDKDAVAPTFAAFRSPFTNAA